MIKKPSRAQRLVFSGLLALFAWGLAELTARVGLRLADGVWEGSAAWSDRSRAASARRDDAAPAGASTAAVQPERRAIVLHPFFGFVRDPAVPNRWWDITDDGFFTRRPTLTEPPGPERFRVAVLGGSVANHFAFGGWDSFARTLAPSLELSRFAVRITSLAMGGYKQPQQMSILAHHLARGDRFDAVINLDGFNEVVLPFDNLRARVAPHYPVNWSQLVGGLPDLDQQERLGEIRYLDRLRTARAAMCPGPLRASALCHLLWRLRDRPLAARQAALRADLADASERRGFEANGPAVSSADQQERMRALVDYWRRSSLQMHAMAERHQTPYFHFLQPNQYLPGSKPLSAEERERFFDPEKSHRPIIETAYPLLRTAGERLAAGGVRFHDLSMLFATVEETVYNDDCCHFNKRGNQLLGEAIGRILAAEAVASAWRSPERQGQVRR